MDTEATLNKLRIRATRLDDRPTLQELIPLAYRVLGAGHSLFATNRERPGLCAGADQQMIEDEPIMWRR